ncbi:EAL domain-containing protein [Andreprevotia chitinilytica]|uniref:EAL domain-containing protein n=1 Tax=Andreprevotia chitinilytica TaxID=396808 RepID=UPI0012EB53EB|nr:EAL domain-containing protein [Andreprevotia chitinilytica]
MNIPNRLRDLNVFDLKIRTQLVLVFTVLLFLMATISGVAVYQMRVLHDEREKVVQGTFEAQRELDPFDRVLLAQQGINLVNENARRAFELFIIANRAVVDRQQFEQVFAQQRETTRQITAIYKKFETTLRTEQERKSFHAIVDARADYVATRTRIEKTLAAGHSEEALDGLQHQVLPRLAVYLNAWHALIELERSLAVSAERDATATYQGARDFMLLLLGVSVVFAGLMAFSVTRHVTTSLREIGDGARRIAGGDFNFRIPVSRRDEIGEATQSFNKMADELNDGYGKLLAYQGELEDRSRALTESNAGLRAEIDLRHEAEQRLRIYAQVVGSTSHGVLISTIGHVVTDVNQAYLDITGYRREEVIGTRLLEHATQPGEESPDPDWREQLAARGNWSGELLLSRKNGEPMPCLATFNEVLEDGGQHASHLVGICNDISSIRQHEAALEYQATHDALTGLPNRALLLDRLNWAISRSARDHKRLAVMFIDLDKFKFINDSLGHGAGDELLVAVAQRLTETIRECDTTARLGGDEFVVLVDQVDDEQSVSRLAQRIIPALAAPVRLGGEERSITCSLGISTYPEDGSDAEVLMKNADIAMYRAKESGRNNFQFFRQEMQVRLGERLSLERQLHRALDRDEFMLHYQPQVDLRSGKIVGLEALIRWQSPELGLVAPARFIPFAEESNLIHGIGEWVLGKTCHSIRAWEQHGVPVVPVSVNVSASQFAQQRIDRLAQQALQSTGVNAKYLELELTESVSMVDPEATIGLMHRLKDLGVSLSIDDFGTGYSNLSYLKRFPVDRLKIDQSFVRGLATGPEEQAISAAVIGLAHALGLRALAEGVETESQLRLLSMLGCDEFQGFCFSHPVAEADAIALLLNGARFSPEGIGRAPYKRTVLLVDDEPGVRASLRRMLKGEALELLEAESAAAAYDLLAAHEVGIILSDYWMPGEDGVTFLSKVRQMYPKTIRILLTGSTSPDTFTTAINRGEIFRFLTKPWDEAEVRNTLREAVQRYEQV